MQDLPEDNKDELIRYLGEVDASTTVVFVHKGGVKGKALLDAIKKVKPEIIACEPLKKEAEKVEFVRNLFLDAGRKASPGAVAALVGALGGDLRELQSAVSQIAADAPAADPKAAAKPAEKKAAPAADKKAAPAPATEAPAKK